MFHGVCYCGDIEFEFPKSSVYSCGHCHCNGCREWNGSAFITCLGINTDVVYTKGKPTMFKRPGAYSSRTFCGKCGTGLMNFYGEGVGAGIKLGILKEIKTITKEFPPHFHT